MGKSSSGQSGGIGFTSLLLLLFIALKLLGKIDWSWWWVLSPLWISVGLVLVVIVLIVLASVIAKLLGD